MLNDNLDIVYYNEPFSDILLWGKSDHYQTPLSAIIPNKDSVKFFHIINLYIKDNLGKQAEKVKKYLKTTQPKTNFNKIGTKKIDKNYSLKKLSNQIFTDLPEDLTVNLLDVADKENLFSVNPKVHF